MKGRGMLITVKVHGIIAKIGMQVGWIENSNKGWYYPDHVNTCISDNTDENCWSLNL